MTTKLSKTPRIPIPGDIQPGDVLVLRDGQRRTVMIRDEDGDVRCHDCTPAIFRRDGKSWSLPHRREWNVVAIVRKSKSKKARPDKDAVWLLKQSDDMAYTATKAFVRRLRAIAKRLNGGVMP